MEGRKDDGGKARVDLLPVDALMEVANVLDFGAQKYEDRNWEKGMKWGRVYGAMLRHAFQWWSGEEFDKESGLRHTAHMTCCALFLLTYTLRNVGEDDREKTQKDDKFTIKYYPDPYTPLGIWRK